MRGYTLKNGRGNLAQPRPRDLFPYLRMKRKKIMGMRLNQVQSDSKLRQMVEVSRQTM